MEDWKRTILQEVEREVLEEDPVIQFFEVVQFQSYSKGKGRRRKFPKNIIFIRPRGTGRWFSWDKEADCSLPWDKWATEVIGFSQANLLGDTLRSQVLDLLDRHGKV